jgi:hypothetical protein
VSFALGANIGIRRSPLGSIQEPQESGLEAWA